MVLSLSGGLRNSQPDRKGKFESLRFMALGAVKGALYSIAAQHPQSLRGAPVEEAPTIDGDAMWDPVRNNNMDSALVNFMSVMLLGEDVSLLLARAVLEARTEIRAKIPAASVATLRRLILTAGSRVRVRPRQCPDRRRAAVFDEPSLSDTGSTRGQVKSMRQRSLCTHRFPQL